MNTLQKLDYVRGKLGLLPAFGDTIGKDVNKAEFGLCGRYASDAVAVHAAMLEATKELIEQHDQMLATFPKGFGWGRIVSDKARAAVARAEADTVPNYPMPTS